jgi:glycosyltransferase involved in cell wall biosynthesis
MSGSAIRTVWRALLPPRVRRLAQPALAHLAGRKVMRALRDAAPAHRSGPLIVSGLLSEAKGISRAAQLTVAGLRAAGFNPIAHDLRPLLSPGGGWAADAAFALPGGVWLLHVNAPEAIRALAVLSPDAWKGRYRIGYWAYELARIPADWVPASLAFDELWAPSTFVAEAMRASGVTKPIRVMPHPVGFEIAGSRLTARRAFTVLAMGDFASSAERKNLAGAIAIYTRAFPDSAAGQRLIIKTHSGASSPEAVRTTAHLAQTRPDITVIDRAMPHAEVMQLIASSHVLLSPHRAEGYGLPLAEALLLGVPVLATGWSGNVDFMGDAPELLISHTTISVDDPHGVYRMKGAQWAEPSIEDAAAKLRALRASPELRQHAVTKAQAALRGQLEAWSANALADTPLARLASPSAGQA